MMRRLALVLPLVLGACGLGGPAYDAPESGVDAVVGMTTFLNFDPAELTIAAGDSVRWQNTSPFTHTVTADPALAADPAHVALPDGARPFHAEVPPGQVYERTFTVPGTYRYVCLPHEGQGMLGVIRVEAR